MLAVDAKTRDNSGSTRGPKKSVKIIILLVNSRENSLMYVQTFQLGRRQDCSTNVKTFFPKTISTPDQFVFGTIFAYLINIIALAKN